MSRLCIKPTCSEAAARWFDVAAADQRVIERTSATPSTLALCEVHAARFSAPDGWTIDSEVDVAEAEVANTADRPAKTVSRRRQSVLKSERNPRRRSRQHDRDRPWFLALSDSAASEVAEPVEEREADEPSVGSLLHRAFHGPDRDVDTERAQRADRDSDTDSDSDSDTGSSIGDICEHGSTHSLDIELPFPPFDAERHAAVS